jgi:tetraacyldisaccharide 4'-kinase
MDGLWYGRHRLVDALMPLSWTYGAAVGLRRLAFRRGWAKTRKCSVPIVVVGNLTVGGTGKTPLVIWLIACLKRHGYRPGVATRGYGGRARHWPQQVRPDADPTMVGDEAVLLAKRCGCPVAAAPERWLAAEGLVRYHGCDIVVCDDGLQHLALARDIEIAVVDGERRFGNGRLLPLGPLREPVSRLAEVDLIVANGPALSGEYAMTIRPRPLKLVPDDGVERPLESFREKWVHAVAGIGEPGRFFTFLERFGIFVVPHPFPDHHAFTRRDVYFEDDLPIIMTEKDAVKCHAYAGPAHWYLPIDAELPKAFEQQVVSLLKGIDRGQKAP